MSELTDRALRWQQIVDEFCEFNPYADRVIMGNFAGWLAARGEHPVAAAPVVAPTTCPVCGRRDIAHPLMGGLEAALRGLACHCGGDTEGHEASEHLSPGEREVFEQVRGVSARTAPEDTNNA